MVPHLLVGIAQLSNEDVENNNQQCEEEEHHDDDGKPAVAVFTGEKNKNS